MGRPAARRMSYALSRFQDALPDAAKTFGRPARLLFRDARVQLRMRHGGERLKPAVLIIGAMKAGTTSCFRYLSQHPSFVAPVKKEIHYFSRLSGERSPAWYAAHFPRLAEVPSGSITGEATPGYIYYTECAERVKHLLPDVKLIALLRDPIARAISHYSHDINKKRGEYRPIDEAILYDAMKVAPERCRDVMRQLDIGRLREPAPSDWPSAAAYVRRGLYADQLEEWFRHFDRDQFLIFKSEDFFANPQVAYERMLSFLELEPADPGPMKAFNVGRSRKKLAPEIVDLLEEIFEEPNRRLCELLGPEFRWSEND